MKHLLWNRLTCRSVTAAVAVAALSTIPGAQAQEVEWAAQAGGSSYDRPHYVALDGAGNPVVAGNFAGTAIFASGEPGQVTLSATGNLGIFVAKYGAGGELAWARRVGGSSGFDDVDGLAVDDAGNVLVAGSVDGAATFGAGEAGETTLAEDRMFVAKYGPDGGLVWAVPAGGAFVEDVGNLALDDAGNVFVSGHFFGTARFGEGGPNETALTSAGAFDIFVAKYDSDGTLQWVTQVGGSLVNVLADMAVDGEGNLVLGGGFYGTATFAGGVDLQSGADWTFFVAKYAPDGTLQWARDVAASRWDDLELVAADADGNVVVSGSLYGRAVFDGGEASGTVLNSAGRYDVFLAKYSADGTLQWATLAGGAVANDRPYGLKIDAAGNPVVAGTFRRSVTFGAGGPNETTLTSAGSSDIFVAKYSPEGALHWAARAGGPWADYLGEQSGSLALDAAGSVFVGGHFRATADFGVLEPNETVLRSAGAYDIFVAKFDADGVLGWATRAGGPWEDFAGLAVDDDGDAVVAGAFYGTATIATEPTAPMLASAGGSDIFIAKVLSPEPQVQMDVSPAECDNVLDVQSKDILSVAVLGATGFDVSQIDVDSVRLEGVAPAQSWLGDVSDPAICQQFGQDGHEDLMVLFFIEDIAAALGEVEDGEDVVLHLTGNLKAAYGGASIEAQDEVTIIDGGGTAEDAVTAAADS